MTVKDWVSIGFLLIVAITCWTWLIVEWQKPILPPEYQEKLNQHYED